MLHLFLNQSQEEVGIFYISLIVGLVDLDEVAEFFFGGSSSLCEDTWEGFPHSVHVCTQF